MRNPLDFTGRVALVTGSAAGLGLATAPAFAEAGAPVVLAGVNDKVVMLEARKLAAAGHMALAISCDVSDDPQVETMVNGAVAECGRLDAAPAAESTRVDWDRVIGINCAAFGVR